MKTLNAFTDDEKTKLAAIEAGAEVNIKYFGEIKQFDISKTGSLTKSALQTLGWAICDGTTPVSQGITSPVIETTPNLQDKFLSMSNDETSGTTGGESSHTLTVAEMPSHTHDVECSLAAGTESTARCGSTNGEFSTTTATGDGDAHNNLPPFYEIVYFIRVK